MSFARSPIARGALHLPIARGALGAARPFGGGVSEFYPGAPFGIPFAAFPAVSANSEFTFVDGNIVIAGGVGNDYRATLTSQDRFVVEGATLRAFYTPLDGDLPTDNLRTVGSNGTIDTPFVDDGTGRYVAEAVAPAGGWSSVVATVTSTSASPTTITRVAYAISPPAASGEQPDVVALRKWLAADKAEMQGNFWPIEKAPFSITAGDATETGPQVQGVVLQPGSTVFVMAYAGWPDEGGAIFDRVHARFVATDSSSLNAQLRPMLNHPGVFGGYVYLDPASLTAPTLYVEMVLDNAQTVAAYTQQAVDVTAVQGFEQAPAILAPSLSFADDHIVVNHASEQITACHSPLFTGMGNQYLGQLLRQYDTSSGNGGLGHCLRNMMFERRMGSAIFAPAKHLYQVGQNETAILLDNPSHTTFTGGHAHDHQRRRDDPAMLIDDEEVNLATVQTYNCEKMERRDYSEFLAYGSDSTVTALLDTIKTFEPGKMTLYQRLEMVGNHDAYALYLFKYSFARYFDQLVANGEIFNTFILPNQGGATITPTGTVNATYPSESFFRMVGTSGLEFEIEVLSGWGAQAQSMILRSGNEVHPYLSPIGIHYSTPGLDTTPVAVTNGQVFEMTTELRHRMAA